MSKCLDKDWHNLKKKDWGNNLEWSEIYRIENLMSDGPYKGGGGQGGVYFILNKVGSEYHVIYIGQSRYICGRLCYHLDRAEHHEKSGNPLLKKYLKHPFNREDCYFMFLVVRGRAKRNKIERECIEKYKPECNKMAGISKKATRQKTMTNTIRSFLSKKPASWGPLRSDSGRLCSYPYLEGASMKRKQPQIGIIVAPEWLISGPVPSFAEMAAEFEPVVIGEWDGEILIMPDIDDKLMSQNIKRFREKLRAMATSKGIQIRNG